MIEGVTFSLGNFRNSQMKTVGFGPLTTCGGMTIVAREVQGRLTFLRGVEYQDALFFQRERGS